MSDNNKRQTWRNLHAWTETNFAPIPDGEKYWKDVQKILKEGVKNIATGRSMRREISKDFQGRWKNAMTAFTKQRWEIPRVIKDAERR